MGLSRGIASAAIRGVFCGERWQGRVYTGREGFGDFKLGVRYLIGKADSRGGRPLWQGAGKREGSEGDEAFCGSDSTDYDHGEGWADSQ
jgi:hypothetical protein